MSTDVVGLPSDEERRFRAHDLIKAAGLTYRQLSDWENRAGVIEADRATSDGWRSFSGEEIVALAICADLRRLFPIPLTEIRPLYLWLVGRTVTSIQHLLAGLAQDQLERMEADVLAKAVMASDDTPDTRSVSDNAKATILREALRCRINVLSVHPARQALLLARLGAKVFLSTTLRDSAILTEGSVAEWIAASGIKQGSILFPLTDTLNRCREAKGLDPFPVDVTLFPPLADRIRELKLRESLTISEQEVIRLIRDRDFQRVTVHVRGGDVVHADVSHEISPGSLGSDGILRLIDSHEYQQIEVTMKNGGLARVTQTTTHKLPSDRRKNRTRGERHK